MPRKVGQKKIITDSPKRKRGTPEPQTEQAFGPRLENDKPELSARDRSPRSIVASQFEDLEITRQFQAPHFGASMVDSRSARKRTKHGETRSSKGFADVVPAISAMQKGDSSKVPKSKTAKLQQAADAHSRDEQCAGLEVASKPRSPTPPRSTSPTSLTTARSPPPSSLDPESNAEADAVTTLTWQDGEITGHLMTSETDPDDDGYGIRGIGFKPTPALAYARSAKRRQQVQEWRAREAREARQKRSERRLKTGGTLDGGQDDPRPQESDARVKRYVRFA